MKIIVSIVACIFFTAPAFSSDLFEVTGFQIIKNTPEAMTLHFQEKREFIISKQRFSEQNSAVDFCKRKGSRLDSGFNSLLIAMSGAANINKFLDDSISFQINGKSGIWQWAGTGNKVTMMLDGHGSETRNVSIENLNEIIEVSLPAICVQKI